MVSRTRLVAVPLVCVLLLVPIAAAQAADGGLTVTPAVLEHKANLGKVGSFTLQNTTKETLRVSVTVRPWRQQLNGDVVSDPKANLTRYVRATRRSFKIKAGQKVPVNFRMVRRTKAGSLFGSVDVFGKPIKTKGRKGIIPQYRLISSLRLHPRKAKVKLRTGAAQVRRGSLLLPVRNLGNTIEPVGGTYKVGSRTGTFKAVRVVPGKLVGLNLGSARGLKKGRYTVTATLTQGNKRINARTSVTVR